MNELAEVIFALVSSPHLLNDTAALKAFLLESGIPPGEIKAMLQVLQSFDWGQQSLSEMLHALTLNAGSWDPSPDWLGVH